VKNYLFVQAPRLFNHDQLLLPDTEYMLTINLGDVVTIKRVDGTNFCHQPFSALLFSHYDKCFRFETTNLFYIVIHFYPTGLYHFLKQSLSSIPSNSFLTIPSIAGLPLQQIFHDSCSNRQKGVIIGLIEQSLLKYFYAVDDGDDVLQCALNLLNQHHCHLSVESLCKQAYSTYRQLDRKFSEKVGFSPKQYAQIVRFRKAYDQIMKQKVGNMIQAVADHNYYDPSD
jgi:AraC-like DNA-binding protein